MYRFGQNDSNSSLSSNASSSVNPATNTTTTNSNNTGLTAGGTNSNMSTNPVSSTTGVNNNQNNNLNNQRSTAIKRSVSQVPSSDRRGLNTGSATTTGTNGNGTTPTEFINSFDSAANKNNIDYQVEFLQCDKFYYILSCE